MDYHLALMTGIDFPMSKECNLIIHPPSIKEISYMGEREFFSGVQVICVNKSMYDNQNIDLNKFTNFDIFMQLLEEKEMKEQKENVISVLNMLFPSYQVIITPRSILFNQEGNIFILDEKNFEVFQKDLAIILCLQQSGQQSFNPSGSKAQEIARKLQQARNRVAAQKAKEEGGSGSMFSQYLSILVIGTGTMNLQQAINLTIYQIHNLIERYSLYINWDLDVRSRLAGAKGEKPVENWMKSIQ